MEKHENISNKQGKKKSTPQINVVGSFGFGGIVLWGGALAVASLVAALAVKRNQRRRDVNETSSPKRKEEDQLNDEGLRSVLQNSSHNDPSNGSTSEGTISTRIDSCKIDSAKSLSLEEKIESAINCGGNEEIRNEEFSFPVLDYSSSELENGIKDDWANKFDIIEIVKEKEEKRSSVHSVSADEVNNENEGEVVKEVLPLASINVELVDCADNSSLMHVGRGGGANVLITKSSPLMDGIEVWKERKLIDSTNLNSLTHANEEKENEDEQHLPIAKSFEGEEEEEETLYDSISSADETSSTHLLKEGKKECVKESHLKERTEEEEAIDSTSKTSADMYSVGQEMEEEEEEEEVGANDNEEEESDEESVKESGSEDAVETSEETESTSAGSSADEIWPEETIEQLSHELSTMQRSKEILGYRATKITGDDFGSIKTDNIDNWSYAAQTYPVAISINAEPGTFSKWRNWIRHLVLVVVLMALITLTHRSASYYLSY